MNGRQPNLPLSSPITNENGGETSRGGTHRVDLTQGVLVGGLWQLVWPIMLASLLQTLVGFADLYMVGRLPEATEAIAAVGISLKITFVVMVMVFAVSTGAQVLVSRSVGARDLATAQRATGQAFLILGLSVGLVASPLGALLAPRLLEVTGAPPAVLTQGTPYLRIMFLTGPAILASFLFAGCLQGAGDSRSPLLLAALINVANVVFNWILIFGHLGFPQLGIQGAALGSFFARWLGAGAAVLLLSSGRLALQVNWLEHLRPDFSLWWRMLRIGIPSGLQALTRALSGWLMVRILALSPKAECVLGGNAIAEQILMITGFIGFAAMPAGMTVVGQNMGAQQPQRAEAGAWAVVLLACGLMVVPAAVYWMGAPLWVRLIGAKASECAVGYGVLALRLLALGEPAWAINMALGGALRGGGDTFSPLLFTIITQLLLGIGGGALVVWLTDIGPTGLWRMIVCAMWIQSAITAWWFRRGGWKTLSV
ncbi:MAG: MATE family efflux transporter [Candidatus Zipacnadales bacterium]